MKHLRLLYCLAFAALFAPAQSQENYKLVWSDEFEVDGRLDSTVWNYENGYARNEELQWYQPDNAFCKDGLLIIEARKERRKNPLYQAGEGGDWRTSREFVECTSSSVTTTLPYRNSFFPAVVTDEEVHSTNSLEVRQSPPSPA